MPYLTLNPLASTYRYHNDTLVQQDSNGTLFLSHRAYSTCTTQYLIDLTIIPPPFDLAYYDIDSVMLELPILRFFFHHYPLYNRIIITNYLIPDEILKFDVSPSSLSKGFLTLDITKLLKIWNPNQTAIFKMVLSLDYSNLSMEIRNQYAIFPKVHIAYHSISHSRFPSHTQESFYIEVCSVNGSNCLIEANGVFLFDSIDAASNISYTIGTGLFSFSVSGIYYIDWMLFIRGTGSLKWIKIGLQNQTTGEVFVFNSPCVIPGQICGQHILHINNTSDQYALINSSESTIQLCSNNETNSSLVIYKLY